SPPPGVSTLSLHDALPIWRNDWKVCAIGGQSAISDSPLGIQFDGPYTGKTWCLDVHAALADPDRNVPAEKHWTLIDEAAEGHDRSEEHTSELQSRFDLVCR